MSGGREAQRGRGTEAPSVSGGDRFELRPPGPTSPPRRARRGISRTKARRRTLVGAARSRGPAYLGKDPRGGARTDDEAAPSARDSTFGGARPCAYPSFW